MKFHGYFPGVVSASIISKPSPYTPSRLRLGLLNASLLRSRDYCIGKSFAAGTGEVHHRTANSLSRLRVQKRQFFARALLIRTTTVLRPPPHAVPNFFLTASRHSKRSLSLCTTLVGSLGAHITVSLLLVSYWSPPYHRLPTRREAVVSRALLLAGQHAAVGYGFAVQLLSTKHFGGDAEGLGC